VRTIYTSTGIRERLPFFSRKYRERQDEENDWFLVLEYSKRDISVSGGKAMDIWK